MITQDQINRMNAQAKADQREWQRQEYGDGFADVMEFIEAVEKIAFEIPAPNRWTPELVHLCQIAKHNAHKLRVEKPREWPSDGRTDGRADPQGSAHGPRRGAEAQGDHTMTDSNWYLDKRPIGREMAKGEEPCWRCEMRSFGFFGTHGFRRVCVCGKAPPRDGAEDGEG